MVKCEEGRVELFGEEGQICAEALTLIKNVRKCISEDALEFFDAVLADFIKPKAVKDTEKIFRLVRREGE